MKPYDEWTQEESEVPLEATIAEWRAYRATGYAPEEIADMAARFEKAEAESYKKRYFELSDILDKNNESLYKVVAANKTLSKRIKQLEPKRGEWIEDGGARGYICTACGTDIHTYKTAYCPDCGADMRREGQA